MPPWTACRPPEASRPAPPASPPSWPASASRCPARSSSGTSAAASPAAAATPTRPPCWQWTRKAGGKTVTRLVHDDQLDDYRQWLDNDRRLRDLVAELEALTLAIADAGPRGKRPTPASARKNRQTIA
jgi:hypothetical protein